MAATFAWAADNGAAGGSPAHGTRTNPITDTNWKNIDDSTTAYSAASCAGGSNSFEKWIYGVFTGTFNSVFNGLWAHTAGTLGTGITLAGIVTSSYTTPSTTTNANLTVNMTAPIAIASGQAVLFSTTSPQAGSPAASITSAGFTQYLVSQKQSTTSVASNDDATVTMTLQYAEN